MLNMFKSPKKQEKPIINTIEIKQDNNCIVKAFENNPISILHEDIHNKKVYYFKASDVGNALGIVNIRTTIQNYEDDDERVVRKVYDPHGTLQDTIFLTSQGVYRLLYSSKKEIAKKFRKWAGNILDDIIFNESEELKKQLEEQKLMLEEKELQLQEKELELIKYKEKVYEEIEKTGHIYVIKTDGGTKVGKTKDAVKKRIKGLQTGNMNDIQVLLDFKTSNADLLERTVHYILDRYRCNSNREFFDCDVDFIKTVVETIGKVIDTLKSCYQQITKEQILTKLSENGIKINLEINSETGSEKTFVNEEKEESELYNWLNNNIELDKNGILKLKKICELYLDTDTIYPKLSNKIRLEIESWIKTKFKHLNFQYKDSYLNGERYRGWIGLKLK
jgi:prophage antirepressor-like protein